MNEINLISGPWDKVYKAGVAWPDVTRLFDGHSDTFIHKKSKVQIPTQQTGATEGDRLLNLGISSLDAK